MLDTATLAATTDNGFKVLVNDTAATISGISAENDKVIIKLSSPPATGASVIVRYALALQSGATVQPIYSESGVTISTAVGNALVSDLIDTSAQSVTLTAVVKCNNTQLAILLGNLVPSNSTTSSGLAGFASAGKGYLTVKPTAAAGSGGISSLTPASGHNQTSNFFIAVSVDKATKKGIIYVQQNSAELTNEAVYTAPVYESALNKFAFGNNAYTGSNAPANTATFAEGVIFDKALTLDEIKAVATRSKDRMKNRGITF
ncbi:hypothetical protein ACU69W_09980 [Acinetobacter baumannii]